MPMVSKPKNWWNCFVRFPRESRCVFQIGYELKDKDALNHLFRVGTGLDSQILGDFEIIAQLKKSFIRSKKMGLLDPI